MSGSNQLFSSSIKNKIDWKNTPSKSKNIFLREGYGVNMKGLLFQEKPNENIRKNIFLAKNYYMLQKK